MAARTNLELMVLSLIDNGLDNSYKMLSEAGLSVSSTLSALARLKRARLVESVKGPHRGQRLSITRAGKRTLNADLATIARTIPPDVEGILRVAFLLSTAKPSAARQFLLRAADSRRQLSVKRGREAELYRAAPPAQGMAYAHRRMRAVVADAQLKAEAEALKHLASTLSKRPA